MTGISDDTKRPVTIRLTSRQWFDGETQQPVRLTTFGTLQHKSKQDVWVLAYDESDATGMPGTRTTLSLYPDGHIRLDRSGGVELALSFVKGAQRVDHLNTPYGPARLSLLTHEAEGRLTHEGGQIKLGYAMAFDDAHAMSTNLELEVESNDVPSVTENSGTH